MSNITDKNIKSNNSELMRNEQIEEMAKIIYFARKKYVYSEDIATALYNAGYRKQSEGEWVRQNKIKGKVTPEAVCSECGREVVYQVIDNKYFFENFCPHCGAKMKGGAE